MDKAPIFIQFDTWKEGDPVIEQWYNMGLWFYLRKANKIVLVGIHNCWKCFTMPQQAAIVSWFIKYVSEHPELDHVYIALMYKKASNLVGAPLGSLTHEEVENMHINPGNYTKGFIYSDPKYQSLSLDVSALIQQANDAGCEVFFPGCSRDDLLAYECLIKTVNFFVGFPFFTLREQGIRLLMKNHHAKFETAAIAKMRGGISMACLNDFAVDENYAYSFELLKSFNYVEMMMANRPNNKDYCPTKDVMTFINDEMFIHERHNKLLVVLKGNRFVLLQHALCFIRRDFGKKKQGLMMDCKNSAPCVFPRIYYDD